jgi:hypothetical protein
MIQAMRYLFMKTDMRSMASRPLTSSNTLHINSFYISCWDSTSKAVGQAGALEFENNKEHCSTEDPKPLLHILELTKTSIKAKRLCILNSTQSSHKGVHHFADTNKTK